MHILFSVLLTFVNVISIIVNFVYNLVVPQKKPDYPPIRSKILTKSVTELVTELRNRKLTSVEIVQAYITRIKEVNTSLNAVIEDRFEQAIRDAERADTMISSTSDENLLKLFMKYPLLGIPFTVKESCGLKGHSYVVGSAFRLRERCTEEENLAVTLREFSCAMHAA
ncbi:fatty-acid amide hydrolase 2-B-like [Teleopsis dalmanni]|uniref:fatty-acid amide hydrolase 2-B-like n=1 Tax=Teleopsis dalmanni TaxID=139649 RepID=UPI0018CD6EE3|nr:fatty-acid amide hydrolase 2-B-like [Teleopsis dalmanni]